MSKQNMSIVKQLGPIVEVDVKLRLPSAIVEYINEVAIKEKRTVDEYCNELLGRNSQFLLKR